MTTVPRFLRVAPGDYESEDGRYKLYRLCDVSPPAWNVEDLGPEHDGTTEERLIVDGARTKADAEALFADWMKEER